MQNLARFRATLKFGGEYPGMDKNIQNRTSILSTAILLALDETSPVKLGPWVLRRQIFTRAKEWQFY